MALAATSLAVLTAAPAQAADPVEIQILATNDFHGRINSNSLEGGAAVLSGAVKQLRTENAHTVFAAAGDLIGASTFESFIQNDKPTIDALNEAGLDVSAVGNHEFDKGYDDLVNRVMKPESAQNPDGGAEWEYIGANVKVKTGSTAPELEPSWVQTFNPGADEVKVGFVGAVTEELPSLVSPAGIEDIDVTDIVAAANTEADLLKTQENLDLVVLLVHEGAPSTNCATMDDAGVFADIVKGVNANVDAIVSGHTHLAYDCKFPVAAWSTRAVKERPVVSAGQYGMNLNQLKFSVDPDDGAVTGLTTAILPLVDEVPSPDPEGDPTYEANYPSDPAVETIVTEANAEAEVLGAEPLGDIESAFDRARRIVPDGDDEGSEPDVVENRGGESTLGNLVAEVQRWATADAAFGSAQIAFMNPGGLRQDMRGNPNAEGATVTYKQAAVVQPFANTLTNMDMTGNQIKQLLEQQWQPAAASRPFLRLGTSKGFEYSYDPSAPQGRRITGIWLNGQPLRGSTTYSVTANSFLAAGGDNFAAFNSATDKKDSGQIDLAAMVDYLAEFGAEEPLAVDYSQHSIGATVTKSSITLSSLRMGGVDDVVDEQVEISLGSTSLGTFDVDNTLTDGQYDEFGTVTLPNRLRHDGRIHLLRVTGAQTGTDILVPVRAAKDSANVKVNVRPKRVVAKRTKAKVIAVVKSVGKAATGKVQVKLGGKTYKASLKNGRATVRLPKIAKPGKKTVRVIYLGNATTERDTAKATFRVVKRK